MIHPFNLEGRTALVTGSSRGLGLAIARALGGAGAVVALNGRDPAQVGAVVEDLAGEGIEAHGLPFDAGDGEAAGAALERFVQDRGRLDILVHNAGHSRRNRFVDYTMADWNSIMGVHLTAGFVLGRAAARHMAGQGHGRILYTSSIVAALGRQGAAAYAAAKGGLDAMVRTMAAELGGQGITVNAIAPGYFETAMTRVLHDDAAFHAGICARTPAGRWGRPEEIGWAALYLASDAGAYVNGHVLTVDGGMSASLGI